MMAAMFVTGCLVGWLLGIITIMVIGALSDGSE